MRIENGVLVQVAPEDIEYGLFVVPDNVKSIGTLAFYGIDKLKEVVIGKNVKKIEDGAFEDCDGLKKVTILGDLDYIGKNAFFFCTNLEHVFIEGSVKKLCKHAFDQCFSLTSVLIPKGCKQIEEFCFSRCENLSKIVFPDSLSYIGNNAFMGTLISDLELPKNLKFMGDAAFINCNYLHRVKLPQTLEKVPSHAFFNCGALEEIEFGDNLTYIDEAAFSRSNIKSLKFPPSLVKIGTNAFAYTYSLHDVDFNDGLVEIDESAFLSSGLQKLELPASVEFIGVGAFKNNSNLEEVNLPSQNITVNWLAFSNCDALRKFSMKDGELGKYALPDVSNLQEVEFGENCRITQMSTLASKFKYINKTENGFRLENTQGKDFISTDLIKNIDIGVITDCWDKREKIADECKNAKIAILYNTLHEYLPKQKFVEFVENKNMKFFNQLCKLNLNDTSFATLCKLFYNLGGFKAPAVETRKTKSGQIVTSTVNYAQIVGEFLKEQITKGTLNNFSIELLFANMNVNGFKKDFTKFFIKEFDNLLAEQSTYRSKDGESFVARCYNDFDAVQRFNTSNKGSQRQLAPTIEKFKEYFNFSNFIGVNEENFEISKAISPFFKTQEAFNLAVKLFDERKKLKIQDHILNVPLSEHPFKKIDRLSKDIKKVSSETVQTMADCAENAFTYEWLSKNDPQNLILGKLCNCCAHIEGVGYGIVHASLVHPSVQNLVVRNKHGEIVAKATLYVNRKKGYGVFNTFKVQPGYSGQKDEIFAKLIKGAKAFIREYNKENKDNPLKKVTVGTDFNDFIDLISEKYKQPEQLLTPIDYSRFGIDDKYYAGDSFKEQYTIWEDKKERT